MALSIAISAPLAVEELHDIFAYSTRSGLLTWKKPESGRKKTVGATAGYINSAGYRFLEYRGRKYSVHSIVWAMHHGKWSDLILDHIDGNPANNRIENLREATRAQNSQNAKKSRRNSSGFKGVSWHKGVRGWAAQIRANGKPNFLGVFATKEEAAAAYDKAATEMHGEFAKTNAALDAEKKRHKNVFTGVTQVKMYHPRNAVVIT